jgi:hypothetical protein
MGTVKKFTNLRPDKSVLPIWLFQGIFTQLPLLAGNFSRSARPAAETKAWHPWPSGEMASGFRGNDGERPRQFSMYDQPLIDAQS